MKEIELNNTKYTVMINHKDAFEFDLVKEKMTEYFNDFDYVLGDYAYGKVRLKGFYNNKNKKVNDTNNFDNYEKYLEEYCAFGCKYFLLKRD